MKLILTIISGLLLAIIPAAYCLTEDLDYELGGQLVLQYSGYYGDENVEEGFVLSDDEFMVRKAAISLHGTYGDHISFEMEFGSERCPFSTSDDVRVLEGSIFFEPSEQFKIGYSRGHVLRGYQLAHDCTDLLAGEKVRWGKAIGACHPTGVQAEFDTDFSAGGGLTLQLSYNNGPTTDSLDDEHDFNIGVNYRSPVDGLFFTGFFTDLETDFNLDQKVDTGSRIGFGSRFDRNNFIIGGEYYIIDGVSSPFEDIESDDLEMRAYYVETAYRFPMDGIIAYVQPYIRFQSWDKGYNAGGNHEHKYLDSGLNMGISGYDAFFRLEYQTRIDEPDGVMDEEDKLIVRLQLNL